MSGILPEPLLTTDIDPLQTLGAVGSQGGCGALDASTDTLDAGEQSFVAEIREHGWFRNSVLGDDAGPGFSYTTGFWSSAGQPELIMFSVKHEIAHNVFWDGEPAHQAASPDFPKSSAKF